jgi:ABC-type antimicrobial peptide transport system permease subunit
MKALAVATGFVGAVAGLLVAVCLLNGWVLLLLWRWFVPVLFPNVPLLTVPVAIGISLIVSLLTHQDMSDVAKKEDTKKWSVLVTLFVRPLFVLLIGWIVRQYI